MFPVIARIEMFKPDFGTGLHDQFFQVIGHDFLLCFMFSVFKVDNARRMIPDSWGPDVLCLTDFEQSGELHLKL
jgi:hypothetical protein